MKTTIAALVGHFALGINALVARTNAVVSRDNGCCFHLSAPGDNSGSIGQSEYGENLIGGNLPEATFCFDADGLIIDDEGRICYFPLFINQFRCEHAAVRNPFYTIRCDGTLAARDDNGEYYACPNNGPNSVPGSYSVYNIPIDSEFVSIALTADNCRPDCLAPPPPAQQPSPSPSPPQKQCPADLNGPFEFPHLIVPVDLTKPDQALGTSFFGQASSTVSTVYNFDVAPDHAGKTCSLVFLFPEQGQLATSSFTVSGGSSGGVAFSRLVAPASAGTTYSNAPGALAQYGVTSIAPGHAYTIATFDCPAGQTASFRLAGAGDFGLSYFQDSNPPPIGLYIRVC